MTNACTVVKSTKPKVYFEGQITFNFSYVIKTKNVDSAYLDKIFGTNAILTFKEGNFFETYDKGYIKTQIYNKNNNRTYLQKDFSDTLYWFDCGTEYEKPIHTNIHSKKENILGIECDELTTIYKNKTVRFYFNPDSLVINPIWYDKFTLSNKNINTKIMKSMYLKYQLDYPDFTVTASATFIKNQSIDSTIFNIPQNKILIEDK